MGIGELLIGWALGLLSQPIAERITRFGRRKELMRIIAVELREFQFKMALVGFRLHRRCRSLDEARIRQIRTVIESYDGPDEDPEGLEASRRFFALPPEQQVALVARAEEGPLNSPLPMKYSLPFTTSHVQGLSICPADFQRRVMQVAADLEIFNDQVDYFRSQFDRTFDSSISEINRKAVGSNLERLYSNLATRSDRLVHEIADLLAKYAL